MTIITNQATGNLQIPDQLILYLADVSHGEGLSVAGLNYDGVTENAFISTAGDPMPGSGNTWADDGGDHVIFHIGGGNPFYEGSLSFDASNALGASGSNTIEIQNISTGQAKGYWTLDGTDAGEVLLGLDGRNQIDGGGGDDIIHGGHDSSGDILMGGAGDDVIFGGSGNDNLQGGDGNDTFLMSAGFGRDDVDGGDGIDIISLDSVLTGAEVADDTAIDAWLALDGGTSADYDHDAGADTITFNGTFSGTIDLGGGNEITFQNIEQIVYTDLV
jgi:Ca2+-binding RTX toxin-like protein